MNALPIPFAFHPLIRLNTKSLLVKWCSSKRRRKLSFSKCLLFLQKKNKNRYMISGGGSVAAIHCKLLMELINFQTFEHEAWTTLKHFFCLFEFGWRTYTFQNKNVKMMLPYANDNTCVNNLQMWNNSDKSLYTCAHKNDTIKTLFSRTSTILPEISYSKIFINLNSMWRRTTFFS